MVPPFGSAHIREFPAPPELELLALQLADGMPMPVFPFTPDCAGAGGVSAVPVPPVPERMVLFLMVRAFPELEISTPMDEPLSNAPGGVMVNPESSVDCVMLLATTEML